MKSVLITGGTGLVGKHLSNLLINKGYAVKHLSRKRDLNADIPKYEWDLEEGTCDDEAILNTDVIIHLAGANISGGKWTNERKLIIHDSRTKSGDLLLKKVKELNPNLEAFIASSATGYYGGLTSSVIYKEAFPPAKDFLGYVCAEWEKSSFQFEEIGVRTVALRTGIVLSKEGGALKKLMLPVKMYSGAAAGTGDQWMPWIHVSDLADMYLFALENTQLKGSFNAVSGEHITNANFTKALAKTLKKPFWSINVPAFMLKLIYGEMAVIILEGSRVSNEKIIQAGFKPEFNEVKSALKDLLA